MSRIRTHQSKRSGVETTPAGTFAGPAGPPLSRNGTTPKQTPECQLKPAGIFQDQLMFVQFLLTLF